MKIDLDIRAERFKPSERAIYDEAINKYCHKIEKNTEIGKDTVFYIIHGTCYRNETCSTEIYNECFGNDKRKSIFRIREVLSKLDGWCCSSSGRKNFSSCYGAQRNIYLRN